MKRYIRLLDNSLVDLIKLKEMFNKNRYTLYEDDKLVGIFDTLDECLVEYFYKYEIIAESDNIYDLLQDGDKVYLEHTNGHLLVYEMNGHLCIGSYTFEYAKTRLTQIYTKHGLVWDKERGVI